MTSKKLTIALTAAAVLGASGTASAGPYDDIKMRIPDIPVGQDVIEHEVGKHCWTYTGRAAKIGIPSGCMTAHNYAATERSRMVSTRADGSLWIETTMVDGTIFSFSAKDNSINVGRGGKGTGATSFAAERGMWQDTINRGWLVPVGEEVRDGRTLVVYKDAEVTYKLDGDSFKVFDKATGDLVESRYKSSTGEIEGIDTVLKRETLPRNAETEKLLAFGDHSGATVREVEGEDAVIASAAKKAGLKKKVRAKIKRKALRARSK